MGRTVLCLAAAAGILVVGAPTGAGAKAKHHRAVAATKGGCALQGAAQINPGLTTAAHPINFGFTGKLTQCKGVTGVTGGTVTATGAGSGSCSGNTTSGTAKITWNTGQTSTLGFTTNGKGVVVLVNGTISSGLFAGLKVKADLVFYTASPQKCALGGLTAASFAGPATLGV